MKRAVIFLFAVLILSSLVCAHNPRIVYKEDLTNNIQIVQNPEISQAFYAELKGSLEYYAIKSDNDFNLYVGILSPDIKDAKKDFSFQISTVTQNFSTILDGGNFEWKNFYEEFAGDNYWQGPEFNKQMKAGVYIITVANPDNLGKYVLVVGKKESFPLKEMLNAVISMPALKIYFEKSPFTAYFNKIGLFMLPVVIILIIFIIVIFYIVRKIQNRKKKHG